MNLAQLLILVLPFLVMWWFLIRPQRQRMAEHRQLMDNVGEGDDIVTTGGIYGTVVDTDTESLYVEIAEGVEIRLSRGAVVRLIEVDEADDSEEIDETIDADDSPESDETDETDDEVIEADEIIDSQPEEPS
ncbi:MAG: preprotein translocase subunit YajC [Actinomycetia bacterium]|nr:preprotein translocase subunit YajC [Actinomycetes bacterium]